LRPLSRLLPGRNLNKIIDLGRIPHAELKGIVFLVSVIIPLVERAFVDAIDGQAEIFHRVTLFHPIMYQLPLFHFLVWLLVGSGVMLWVVIEDFENVIGFDLLLR
jgi:hypothetical protein